jgi:hypothetical protein
MVTCRTVHLLTKTRQDFTTGTKYRGALTEVYVGWSITKLLWSLTGGVERQLRHIGLHL